MALGFNSQGARDLLPLLYPGPKNIRARNLRVGDIIIDDFNVWEVQSLTPLPKGGLQVGELDENDTIISRKLLDMWVTIVDRRLVKKLRKPRRKAPSRTRAV